MRRRLAGALAAILAIACAAPAANAAPARSTDRWLAVLERPADARSPELVANLLERFGLERAGPGAPSLGVVTLRGPLAAVERLRSNPAVAGVSREWLRDLRRVPNDPAVGSPEGEYAVPPGTPIQWALARQGFPAAWDVTTGAAARVAVLDTGIDGGHPELAGEIESARTGEGGDPRSDPDETIVRGIELAMAHSPHAINMSFGGGPDSAALDAAIQAAYDRGIVLVAAASNEDDDDGQGAPASQLQPGDAANIDAGRGLVVTAADFADTRAGTGRGDEISLAAYGFYDEERAPPGLISTYPGVSPLRDPPGCPPVVPPACSRRDLNGDDSYAYLQG